MLQYLALHDLTNTAENSAKSFAHDATQNEGENQSFTTFLEKHILSDSFDLRIASEIEFRHR